MSHRYCFIEGAPSEAQELILGPEESAHLVRVHRLRAGDAVTAFDGNGSLWHGCLSRAHAQEACIEVQRYESLTPPGPRVHLAQALPKGKLLDSILNATTQLGLSSLQPIITQRTDIQPHSERWSHQHKRLHQIAIEACKQSHNPFIPKIYAPISLETLLQSIPPKTLTLYASLAPNAQPASSLPKAPELLWIIGPEGGFSPAENAQILEAQALPISLGPYTLRLETAALCAVFVGSLLGTSPQTPQKGA